MWLKKIVEKINKRASENAMGRPQAELPALPGGEQPSGSADARAHPSPGGPATTAGAPHASTSYPGGSGYGGGAGSRPAAGGLVPGLHPASGTPHGTPHGTPYGTPNRSPHPGGGTVLGMPTGAGTPHGSTALLDLASPFFQTGVTPASSAPASPEAHVDVLAGVGDLDAALAASSAWNAPAVGFGIDEGDRFFSTGTLAPWLGGDISGLSCKPSNGKLWIGVCVVLP